MPELNQDFPHGPLPLTQQWQRFHSSRDQHVRAELIEHYLVHARRVAARLYRLRIDNSVSFDDYLQYARTGLLEAIDRFDPDTAVSFESFSLHRIRGAVLNGLGSESEQAAQRKAGLPVVMYERLDSLGQRYTEEADEGSLNHWVNKAVGVAIGLILDRVNDEQADESEQTNPYANVELLYLRRRIVSYVSQLPAREAEVIRLHYFEHFEFQFVAERLGITKGRVSQLHQSGLLRLKKLLGADGQVDTSL